MRVIAVNTLKLFWKKYPRAKQALLSWYDELKDSNWDNPNELKSQYRNASIVSNKRVVFNIQGNDFRLIVDIEFRLKIVFIVWFGTPAKYDKLDVKKVNYVKVNKNK